MRAIFNHGPVLFFYGLIMARLLYLQATAYRPQRPDVHWVYKQCYTYATLTELVYGLILRTGRGMVRLEKTSAAVLAKSSRSNLQLTRQPVTKIP
jgi:hypothetical protein